MSTSKPLSRILELAAEQALRPQNNGYSWGDKEVTRASGLIIAGIFEREQTAAASTVVTPATEAAMEWLTGKTAWLVLTGGVGVGKTMGAVVALMKHYDAGNSVAMVQAADLVQPPIERVDWAEKLKDRSLVCVDDLGVESLTDYGRSRLLNFFAHRHSRLKRTIITTNLSADELSKRLGQRVVDRIRGDGRIVAFEGASLRNAHAVADVGSEPTNDEKTERT